MTIKARKLTTKDVCAECGVNARTVRKWLASGLKATDGKDKSGRKVNLIDRRDLDEFLANREKTAAPRPPSGKKLDPDGLRAALLEAMAADGEDDDIEKALSRISKLERIAYRLANEMGHPDLIRAYKDVAAGRRQLEKDLPEILYRQGRYVDAEKAGQLITKAVTGMCAELDQVGISVADLCVGKTAREIREEIDAGIRRAREHIKNLLEEACRAT